MGGELISFGDALKAFRRNVYTFPHEWRALVVCEGPPQVQYVFDEATRILEASSLKVENVLPMQRLIQVERGGEIRFTTTYNVVQGYTKGIEVPHIMVCVEPSPQCLDILRLSLRHPDIEERYFRLDKVTV